MADEIKYAISLEDHVTPHAKMASSALANLQTELTGSKQKLALYQQQLARAKAIGDVEGFRKYSKLVADARKETFLLSDTLMHSGEGVDSLGDKLTSSLGAALTGVAGLAVKAAAAIGAALAGMAVEGVKTALEVGEVNERLTATFEALGDKPGQGKKTLDFLNKLSTELPQSREQLAGWAKEYEAFGITDLGQLRQQIKATASAQAILGDEGASAYAKLAEKIQDAARGHHALKMGRDVLKDIGKSGANASAVAGKLGLTLEQMDAQLKAGTINAQAFGNALSSTLIEKGKGPLESMGNELGTLGTKAAETFHHLFDGIDTSPITDALKGVIMLGDQGEPSGQAMKKGIGAGVQGIITWLGKLIVESEIAFLTLELWVVRNRAGLTRLWVEAKMAASGFLDVVTGIWHAAQLAADALLLVQKALHKESLADVAAKVTGGTSTAGKKGFADEGTQPAHARGGVVGRPAHGEFFASVAPGEMILPEHLSRMLSARVGIGAGNPQPARQPRQIVGGGLGFGGLASVLAAANTNAGASGGRGTHIESLHLTIHAKDGVTDATAISAHGLAVALERYQLASGR